MNLPYKASPCDTTRHPRRPAAVAAGTAAPDSGRLAIATVSYGGTPFRAVEFP